MKKKQSPHTYFKRYSKKDVFTVFSQRKGAFWSETLIDYYIKDWNWTELSKNKLFFNSVPRIQKYEAHINFNEISNNIVFSRNTNEQRIEIIEAFKERLNWKILSRYYKYINSDFIQDYASYIHWDEIRCNEFCHNNIDFIETYKEQLNWDILSQSVALPWSEKTILRFADYWNWELLIANDTTYKGFFWTKNFVNQIITYLPSKSLVKKSILAKHLVYEECSTTNLFKLSPKDKELYYKESYSIELIIASLL